MAGPRTRLRYEMIGINRLTRITGFVDCDEDALTATLNSVSNTEASLPVSTLRYQFLVPTGNGGKGALIRARAALLRYTGAIPPGRRGRLVWVPVFRIATFNLWRVDQTGTHKGLPVVLDRKVDGNPSVLGQ